MIKNGLRRLATIPISVIILLNLVLKLGMFCYVSPWDKSVEANKIVVSDAKNYEWIAENLVKAGTFASPKDTLNFKKLTEYQSMSILFWDADALRMPGYPAFMAFFYKLLGIKPFIVILAQILLSLISVFLTYKICVLFGQKEVGTIAALLYAIDIHSIYVSNLLLTETLFVALLTIGIYYFVKAVIKKGLTEIMISSFFIGAAALTRGVLSLYPLIIIAIILLCTKANLYWKIKAVTAHVLIFGFMLGLWAFRNHNEYNHWQLTTQGGYALAMYNASILKTKLTHGDIDSVRVTFQQQTDSLGFREKQNPFDRADMYAKVGLNYMAKHKMDYMIIHAQGAMYMYLSLGNMSLAQFLGWDKSQVQEKMVEVNAGRIKQNFTSNIKTALLGVLILIVLCVQYAGAIIGAIKWKKFNNPAFFLLCLLTFIYFSAITGVYGMYRYKLPLVPLICIVSAYYYRFLSESIKGDAK
jgi:4-amino-4-deoxy-L-arabinose transferase-like glycosyltransferase